MKEQLRNVKPDLEFYEGLMRTAELRVLSRFFRCKSRLRLRDVPAELR